MNPNQIDKEVQKLQIELQKATDEFEKLEKEVVEGPKQLQILDTEVKTAEKALEAAKNKRREFEREINNKKNDLARKKVQMKAIDSRLSPLIKRFDEMRIQNK